MSSLPASKLSDHELQTCFGLARSSKKTPGINLSLKSRCARALLADCSLRIPESFFFFYGKLGGWFLP